MKISVCQFYTSNVSYGEYAEKINSEYCLKNGYNYYVEKDSEKIKGKIVGRSFTWYKPHLILETFERFADSDYILFLDIDAIFCNNNRKIEEFITDDSHIIMTNDYGPSLVNAGVMLLKKSDYVKQFLNEWWEICEQNPQYKEGLWHDQTCIGLWYNKQNDVSRFKIINNFDFNAREYNDERFIFHAFSYGMFPNRTIDQIYDKKFPTIDTTNRENIKAIVYHIFCDGDYKNIVSSQIQRLISSGLYEWCDVVEVTCVDTQNKFEGIEETFQGLDKVKLFKTNDNAYEFWGINKVWELSQQYNGQVLYFHAKGVSNLYTNLQNKETNQWKSEGVSYWRDMMEYFLIDNYQECLNKLLEYDSCGAVLNHGWFWGNFWWSNLSHIRKNPKPNREGRWYYEDWLNRGRMPNNYSFIDLITNLYFSKLPADLYLNPKSLQNKQIEVVSSFYGTLGIQQDEGYPSDIPLVQSDVTDIVKNHFRNNKLSIYVDNSNFGDPIYGHKKFLLVNIKIDDIPYRLVYNEGIVAKFEL
jgi:hypothetical protein